MCHHRRWCSLYPYDIRFFPFQAEKALEQKERKSSGHPKETDVKSGSEGKELKHKGAVLKIEEVAIEGLSIDDVKTAFKGAQSVLVAYFGVSSGSTIWASNRLYSRVNFAFFS